MPQHSNPTQGGTRALEAAHLVIHSIPAMVAPVISSCCLLITRGFLKGQLASQLWMSWIWDLQGVGFRTIPGHVHNDERSVSSEYTGASTSGQHRASSMQTEAQCFQNPLGHTTLAVKAEEKVGRSFLYVTDC